MRTALYSVLLISIFFLPNGAKAQWNPKATGTTLPINCISHGSSSAIFAAGFSEFFRSTNGGATWEKTPFIDNFGNQVLFSNFTDIHFFNANEGVVVGNLGGFSEYILRTTNGGNTWTEVHSNNVGASPPLLNELDFPTPSVGFAVGRNGRVLKTTNGGETWIALPGIPVFSEIYSVDFINEQIGCITTSANTVQRTTDGGQSWNVVHIAPDVHSVSFTPDGSVGYVCGGNTILRSLDQGATWAELPNPIGLTWVVKAVSIDTVLISTFSNGLNISTSGGQYWEKFPTIPQNQTVYGMSFIGSQMGCIVGLEGSLRCTDNAGGPATPVPVFTTDETLFCEDSVVHFTNHSNPAYTFIWKYNGATVGTGTHLDFAFPQGGTGAEINLTANNGSLSGTATQSFNIEPSLGIEPFSLSLAQPNICPGEAHTVLAANLEYYVEYQLWQGGQPVGIPLQYLGSPLSFPSLPMPVTAPLTLRGTKTGTCGTGILEQAITAPVVPPPSLGLAVSSPDDAICEFGSTTIQVQGSQSGVTYQLLLDGVPTGNAVAGTGGNLTLPTGQLFDTLTITVRTVQLASGCANTLNGSVWMPVEKKPTTYFTLNTYNQTVGDPILTINNSINPGGTYEWTFAGATNLPTSTEAAPADIYWEQPGTYNVTLLNRSPLGCASSYLRTVRILPTLELDSCMGSFIKGAGGAFYGLSVDGEGNRIAFINAAGSSGITASSPAGDAVTIPGTIFGFEGPYYLVKFDERGISQWATKIRYYNGFSKAGAIDTDDEGNIYCVFYHGGSQQGDSVLFYSTDGKVRGTNPPTEGLFQNDAYLAKYDKHGVLQWFKPYPEDYTIWQMQLLCDDLGNVYLGNNGLTKYSSSGELVWFSYTPNPYVPGGVDPTTDLEFDAQGNVVVSKSYLGVQKVSPEGNLLFNVQPLSLQGQLMNVYTASMEIDNSGNIYLAGNFGDTLSFGDSLLIDNIFIHGNADGFVAKMDSVGQPIWVKQIKAITEHKISGFDLNDDEVTWFAVAYGENKIEVDGLPTVNFTTQGHYTTTFDTAGNPILLKKLNEDQFFNGCNVTLPFEDFHYSPINGLPVFGFEHRTGFEFEGQNFPASEHPCEFFIANASLDCFNAPDFIGVWPGDCNDDGTANHVDVLSIGLGMGNGLAGSSRLDQGIDWAQKPSLFWGDDVLGKNAGYVDSNGDGLISPADTLAIVNNYELVHGFAPEIVDERSGKIKITIGAPIEPLVSGEVATFPILLFMPDSLPFPLYGVAFQVEPNPWNFYLNAYQIDMTDSWLNTDGNAISFVGTTPFQPKKGASQVRTDGQDAIGTGKIGDIIGRVDYSNDQNVFFHITGNLAINANEDLLPIQGEDEFIPVGTTCTNNQPLQSTVQIYPVPAKGFVFLELPSGQTVKWTITDVLGQPVKQGIAKEIHRIDVAEIPAGHYFININHENGTQTRRSIIFL